MGHIHDQPGQHDITVGAMIVDTSGNEPKVFLHVHKKLGQYIHFGGHVELDENPWEAIKREILEETGYSIDQLKLLQPQGMLRGKVRGEATVHPLPFEFNTHPYAKENHFHSDLIFAFLTDQEPKHEIGDDESKEIVKFTAAELKELLKAKIPENIRLIAINQLDNLLKSWEVVESSEFS